MKDLGHTVLILLVYSLFFVRGHSGSVFGQEPDNISGKGMVQKIIDSERAIHDVEAHYDYILGNGFVLKSLDWGYEGGKEYTAGSEFRRANKDDEPLAFEFNVAFDGEKIRRWGEAAGYRDDNTIFKAGLWGRVCPFEWDHFLVCRPTTLLGYDVSKGRRSFGEILRDAPELFLKEKTEEIDGHSCRILEAIGVADRDLTFDLRIWLDMERDFRPLRIEQYHNPESIAGVAKGKKRWEAIARIIEDIKLEKINGVWFPIDGRICSFFPQILPPEGMTEDEFERLGPDKKGQIGREVLVPGRAGKVRVRVDRKTVRINEGISPEKFTLVFPQGCKIYDDFIQGGYTVGQPDADVDRGSLEDLLKEPKSESSLSGEKSIAEPTGQSKKLPDKGYNKPLMQQKDPVEKLQTADGDGTMAKPVERRDNSYIKYTIMAIVIISVIGILIAFGKRTAIS